MHKYILEDHEARDEMRSPFRVKHINNSMFIKDLARLGDASIMPQ